MKSSPVKHCSYFSLSRLALPLAMLAFVSGPILMADPPENLLLNGEFRFSSFDNSRAAATQSYRSGSVPFWNQDAYGSAEVYRATRNPAFNPRFPVEGVVVLHPGKSIRQFALMDELKLDAGDVVSLSVFGFQKQGKGLRATISALRVDEEEGEWSPAAFGQNDKRTFPKKARGELIPVEIGQAESGEMGDFELRLEKVAITWEPGTVGGRSDGPAGIVGVQVEFTNISSEDVWIYSPSLVRGTAAGNSLRDARPLPEFYRHIPRTIAKLRRGEPLHIVSMGSSIDRASANPPLYLYDEAPGSPKFKEPLSTADLLFDGEKVGHPEWTPYFGRWAHYLGYTGRLRQSLMCRYDYPIDKILLNVMACDGSSIGESHSALAEWTSLVQKPDPELNGHKAGRTWKELYPSLFARSDGTGPDLVIFGSGANEKIDGADEVAAFEGAIRWFQRHYPDVEFVFCMWQNRDSYTPNTGMLKDLALHYGIPLIDLGREFSLLTRHVDITTLVPKDGHPQAAAHFIWGTMLERAFQYVDPIAAGIPQSYLPRRLNPFTTGWEGEMETYEASSPRIRKGTAFILDETVVNLWADSKEKTVAVRVDGLDGKAKVYNNGSRVKPASGRNPRNSVYAIGRLDFGDQHLLEVVGDARIVAVDAKTALNRRWQGIESKGWKVDGKQPGIETFVSEWGAPYGTSRVTLKPGEKVVLRWSGTDCSVAWLAQPGGGTLVAAVDGGAELRQPTGEAVELAGGEKIYMENRKALRGYPFGSHELLVRAEGGPVSLLGAFLYDTRANRSTERVEAGMASPGDILVFSAPFRATPLVFCSGGLQLESVSREAVTFSGADGAYQIVGE